MTSLVHRPNICDEKGKMPRGTTASGRFLTLPAAPVCSSPLFWQLLIHCIKILSPKNIFLIQHFSFFSFNFLSMAVPQFLGTM